MLAEPTIDYDKLSQTFQKAENQAAFYKAVADAPFEQFKAEMAMLFLGFISFFLVDEASQKVYAASASDTEQYRLSISGYNFDLEKFRLDLKDSQNHIVKAILEQKPIHNVDWNKVSRPRAEAEAVRLNQANSGIASIYIYPLGTKTRGALMYNFFQYAESIGKEQFDFMDNYTQLVSARLDA